MKQSTKELKALLKLARQATAIQKQLSKIKKARTGPGFVDRVSGTVNPLHLALDSEGSLP